MFNPFGPKPRQLPCSFIFINKFDVDKCREWLQDFISKCTDKFNLDTISIQTLNLALQADNSIDLDNYDYESIVIEFLIRPKQKDFNQRHYLQFHLSYSTQLNPLKLDERTLDFIGSITLSCEIDGKAIYLSKKDNPEAFSEIPTFLRIREVNEYLAYESSWIKKTLSGSQEFKRSQEPGEHWE